MKRVMFLISRKEDLWEGLRSSLGLLVENNEVSMTVLDNEVDMTEAYRENLEWFLDMEGTVYSNHPVNIESHGFGAITIEELGRFLKDMDHVVPF